MESARSELDRLDSTLRAAERRRYGRYFTPPELVEFILELAAPSLPSLRRLAIIDPACGAGAFLACASRLFPEASLLGLEISPEIARACREQVPAAQIVVGDGLRGGLVPLLERIPAGAFEFWVGNPPYNGTSALLRDPAAYARLKALLPKRFALPEGTSLRDDYAFFLLVAAARLATHPGTLAFLTSATLLDSYLYIPVRRALLHSLELREVIDLGAHLFAGTRVRTCVTIWTSARGASRPRYRCRTPRARASFHRLDVGAPVDLSPKAPEYFLRSNDRRADALDALWRREGEALRTLVPINFPGLKTRFNELLVDEDPARLLRRVEAFVTASPDELPSFAQRHEIPEHCLDKLRRLHSSLSGRDISIDPRKVRPFLRYAGSKHREGIPASAHAYCYLDRRFIPRGDHRLRGEYDPHASPVKLVYNARELPLSAALVESVGCIHDHRHARFAPLFVPALLVERGLGIARRGEPLGPDVPNLSRAALALAKQRGGPVNVFRAVADFINSQEVQQVWAPAFGTTRDLPVPVYRWLEEDSGWLARRFDNELRFPGAEQLPQGPIALDVPEAAPQEPLSSEESNQRQ